MVDSPSTQHMAGQTQIQAPHKQRQRLTRPIAVGCTARALGMHWTSRTHRSLLEVFLSGPSTTQVRHCTEAGALAAEWCASSCSLGGNGRRAEPYTLESHTENSMHQVPKTQGPALSLREPAQQMLWCGPEAYPAKHTTAASSHTNTPKMLLTPAPAKTQMPDTQGASLPSVPFIENRH